jgi:pimeloyl-[acyl-carrier protein] methyl ester esterase
MDRRQMVQAGLAATLLAGCASARTDAAPGFVSDRLSVDVRGAGPDVVLIPGLACGRAVWDGLAAALSASYRLHLVQLTGFGEPMPPPAGPLFELAAQEVMRYIQEAGLSQPAIIGHSMGGTLALRIAAAEPALIGRVMAVDALPFFSVLISPTATVESIAPQAAALADQMRGMDDAAYLALQQRTMPTLVKGADNQALAVGWSVASNRPAIAQMMQEVMTTDLRPQLSAITAPATVLYAWDASMPYPAAGADFVYTLNYAGLRGARLVRVDEALHFIMLDQPARFEAEVRAFLG